MFKKDDSREEISRLESRFGLTTENATILHERGQRVAQLRQEAEQLLGHALPSAFSDGLIEAFYNHAPEIAVSMWKVQLDTQATLENCTVLLELEVPAYDLRDDTKWFAIDVRQDYRILQQLEVKLSPSVALAGFAREFEQFLSSNAMRDALEQKIPTALDAFQDAIFESVMEQPSENLLEVVGPGAGDWTFYPQTNLKISLLVGLKEEGGGGWLPKVKADREKLLAVEDREDTGVEPTIQELLKRQISLEEWGARLDQAVTASKIVDALERGLSMRDLFDPVTLCHQFYKERKENEPDSQKLVALAYLRQLYPPSEGVSDWIDEQIKDAERRVERRTAHFTKPATIRLPRDDKIELMQRLIYSRYVLNALIEHADVLKQELSAGSNGE